jgi:hypothetical protein
MSFDGAREYLSRVLPWPQDGDEPAFVNVHWTFRPTNGKIKTDKHGKELLPWTGRAVRSVDDAIKAVDFALRGADTRDVYVCMATQHSAIERISKKNQNFKWYAPVRLAENAVALKSLFLDIDAKGVDKNSYDSMDAAIAALAQFLKGSGMPKPSLVVASGGGLHTYWTLDRALTPPEWQPLANALAEATKALGLKCDTQCTVDSVRVLRLPDTFNHKTTTPRPVKLASAKTDFDYSVARIEQILTPYITTTPSHVHVPSSLFPRRAPVTDNALSSGIAPREALNIDLVAVGVNCAFIRDAINTKGASLPNPLWNLTTLIATFTSGGPQDAHDMASGHPGYTPASTDELYERKQRERARLDLGWPRCQSISTAGATQCQSCPNFPLGKSPLNFGLPSTSPQLLPTGTPTSVSTTTAGTTSGFGPSKPFTGATPGPTVTGSTSTSSPLGSVPTPASGSPSASDLPAGYVRDAQGLINALKVDPDGTNHLIPICEYRMDNPWLQKDPWVLHFDTVVERGNSKQILVPTEAVGGMGMRACLQEQALMLPIGNNGVENVSRFVMSWIKKLQDTRDSVTSSPFGWCHANRTGRLEGFVFGGELWMPGGNRAAANPNTVIARQYEPTGGVAPWTAAASLITSQGRPDLDAILASAFAAPLVKFTGHSGVVMSAYSIESGIGKTTALKVAQAVWGDPVKGIASLGDTHNSVMGKIGELQSLPIFWDELKTEEDTAKFVNMVFETTGGKGKARMNSRAQQRELGEWQTLLVSCSNDSLLDYVANRTVTTTAGLYRVFEFVVRPPTTQAGRIEPSTAQRMIAALHHNYGHAGLTYAQFLGANHARVDAEMATFMSDLGKEVATTEEERFWLATIGVILMGARYANELNLTAIDEVALKDFLLSVLAKSRAHKAAQPNDIKQQLNITHQLAQFLGASRSFHTLTTNRIHVAKGKPPANTIKVLHDASRLGAIHVHIGMDDKLMRISSAGLGEWLTQKKISRHIFTTALMSELGATKVIGRMGSGTMYAGMTEYLFQIDLAGTPLTNFIDEA